MADRNGNRGVEFDVTADRQTEIDRTFDALGLLTEDERKAKRFETLGEGADEVEVPRFVPRLANTSDMSAP